MDGGEVDHDTYIWLEIGKLEPAAVELDDLLALRRGAVSVDGWRGFDVGR